MKQPNNFTTITDLLYVTIQVSKNVDSTERHAMFVPFKCRHSEHITKANLWAYNRTVDVNIEPSMEITVTHTGNSYYNRPHITSLSIFASNSQPRFIKNEPQAGIKLIYGQPSFVITPDNLKVSINPHNVYHLIQHCTIVDGIITTPCIWGEYKDEVFLLSTTSPHYTKAVAYTEKLNKKIDFSEVSIGDVVDIINESIFEKHQICTYVGKYWFAFLHIDRTNPNQRRLQIKNTYLNVFSSKSSMFVIQQPVVSRIIEKTPLLNQRPVSINKIKNMFQNKLHYFYSEVGTVDQLLHVSENVIKSEDIIFLEENVASLPATHFSSADNWPKHNTRRIIPLLTFKNNEKYMMYENPSKLSMRQIEFVGGKLIFPPTSRTQRRTWQVDVVKLAEATVSRLKVMCHDVEIYVDPKIILRQS